jgi:hypothetical protein
MISESVESVESPARELIQLSFPASGDLVVLARFTAATVAARAGFDIDEIEDLRLAVDELCVSLGPLGDGASVRMEFGRLDDTVTVVCTVDGPVGDGPSAGDGPNPLRVPANELSEQLLDALVEEHGREMRDGHLSAWMSMRRGVAGASWNG